MTPIRLELSVNSKTGFIISVLCGGAAVSLMFAKSVIKGSQEIREAMKELPSIRHDEHIKPPNAT